MGTSQDTEPVIEFFLAAPATNGYGYYCGRCGKVWGRLRTLGNRYFSPYSQSCVRHWKEGEDGVNRLWPGTMLIPLMYWHGEFFGEKLFPYLLDRLSDEHLAYEFHRALEWAEKEAGNEVS